MSPGNLSTSLATLGSWPARRWATALITGVGFALLVAIPTDLIDTAYFGREVPPTWWAWPSLVVSAVLAGLLVATYVTRPADSARPDAASAEGPDADETTDRAAQRGWVGGALTFFAVGCPVCNKLVLLALGSAGAMTWFEPVQPVLQVAAVALLLWALHQRLQGETRCPTLPRIHTAAGEIHD